MRALLLAITLLAGTATAQAEDTDHRFIAEAVEAQGVTAKLKACLKREPLERGFITMCMMAATSFTEVQTYKTAPAQ